MQPDRIQLAGIQRVTFFKRDELTTDLICCQIETEDETWLFDEEMPDWAMLISCLEALPGFRADWRAAAVKPPFEARETVAFNR